MRVVANAVVILRLPTTCCPDGQVFSSLSNTPRKTWRVADLLPLRAPHHIEEVVVGFGHRQLIDQEFHRISFTHRMNNFAQDPHFL